MKRLGHCVLNVKNFSESEAWYKSRFGLITSDEINLSRPARTRRIPAMRSRPDPERPSHPVFVRHRQARI